jgi:hypothetical protein
MADMVHYRSSGPLKDRGGSSDIAFIVWAAIVSIGLIVVAYALSASPGVDPNLVMSIFAAP